MKSVKAPLFMYAGLLLVGDSHSYQSFGRNLDGWLRTLPSAQVSTYASWGSSPSNWYDSWVTSAGYFEHDADGKVVDVQSAPTPLYEELLARLHPALTIIALGSNLYSAPDEYSASTVKRMVQATVAAHSDCIWVGPPDMRSRGGPLMEELYGVLREATAPCRLVDSRRLTHYPAEGGDGIHYDYLGAEGLRQTSSWARKIYEAARDYPFPR